MPLLAQDLDTKETKNERKSAGGWFETSKKKYLFTLHVAKLWDSAAAHCRRQKFLSPGCGRATLGAQPSPQPAPRHLQKLGADGRSPWTPLSDTRTFLKGKRDWTHHLAVLHFKHRATLCRQCHTSSFHPHGRSHFFISPAPVPLKQNAAGEL